MSILIAYASKYGCTKKCAEKLAQKLEEKVDLLDLKSGNAIELSGYDKVVIGSSIYVGKVHKEVSEFCMKNLEELKRKKIGLFICGTQLGEALDSEINTAYPEELQLKALAVECLGGEYNFGRMSFIDKAVVKVIAKTNKDFSNVAEEKISSLAKAIKGA